MTDGGVRGFILAAGYGTRLAPVSDHLPKPLLPVPGGTVLDRAADALLAGGCSRIGVNTHHLPDLVAAHVRARPDADRFTLFHEPAILGTGGALDHARAFLQDAATILLHNGDVLADVDVAALLREHRRTGALATLVLVDWPAVNSVRLDDDGAVLAIADGPAPCGRGRALTYAGIAALDPALLADIGPGFSSLIPPLVRAIARRPGAVRGWAPADAGWTDLGTLPRYLATVGDAGPLDGGQAQLVPITGQGSDRRFWRLQAPGWSAVAMQGPPDDPEFARGAAIMRFLHGAGLGAAAVLAVHDDGRTLLAEDLGDQSLHARAQSPDRAAAYAAVIDHLVRLQAATDDARAQCPEAVDRCLDQAMLAWETGYFSAAFLGRHGGLPEAELAALAPGFAALNAHVAAQPRVLLHRDFQSTNILLHEGRVRLVDVQGMRLGPLGYDAASLLWDPYVDLSDAERDALLARFSAAVAPRHGVSVDEAAAAVLAAGLQRVMQALGAFGFLGHAKGKTAFLVHIPRGLANLRDLLARNRRAGGPVLPELEAVLQRLPAGA